MGCTKNTDFFCQNLTTAITTSSLIKANVSHFNDELFVLVHTWCRLVALLLTFILKTEVKHAHTTTHTHTRARRSLARTFTGPSVHFQGLLRSSSRTYSLTPF